MKRLFHGSNIDISTIDLNRGRPFKDFGQGFYLTDMRPQAVLMAERTAKIYENL